MYSIPILSISPKKVNVSEKIFPTGGVKEIPYNPPKS
jgi:hypothetical protein